ncbi:putative polysaccharide biosynthesis domain-containing protein [Helianthus annuus]|nr:putative polysaccharide biosynthesis domain-containing protein [Helianthus annuus]
MKTNNNGNNTKLILLHAFIQKQGNPNRLWLIALMSVFALASLLTLVYTRESFHTTTTTHITATINHQRQSLPKSVVKALVHYAANANSTDHMSQTDVKQISDVLKQCTSPCNFLVFGLTRETLLWNALNNYGRTVFIDENRYYAAYMEEKYPEIEAYDVQYTTKISELNELVTSVREQARNECRPVQNLLFSDCKIGLNDLPNQLYELDWDVILVDGPRGYWPEGPGSISAIFTASVLARSKKGGNHKTHVFVHNYNREVEKVSSEEFLCKENLVKSSKDLLAHFVVERVAAESGTNQFCHNHPTTIS